MGHTLFISDLHLCESRPQILSSFLSWLTSTASKADALYVLGDLFEYWAGDDVLLLPQQSDNVNQTVANALRTLTNAGVSVYMMHGNRDFLIGDGFCNATGVKLLNDPTMLTLYGQRVLLSHGDALCVDDVDYMQFRQQVRQPNWQQQFLASPLQARLDYIASIRQRSESEKTTKSMAIMDVNVRALEQLLAEFAYPSLFIHGHTHRPNVHLYKLNGHAVARWVLGDWYEQGSYIVLDKNGAKSEQVQFN
jgi:UDP-2,3-diacylglucosamine hydrolase